MSREPHNCETVTCDRCKTVYGNEDDAITFHIPAGTIPDDWTLTPDGQDQCGKCTDELACLAAGGHHWESWRESGPYGPYGGSTVAIITRSRYCNTCEAEEYEQIEVPQ